MSKSRSKLIVALDLIGPSIMERALRIIDEVHPHIAAVKINRHLLIPLSMEEVSSLVKHIHDRGLLAIADVKVNDIGSTNRVIAELYFKAGFDALTACPFTGWKDGLEPIFTLAKGQGRGVLLLVYMSHEGASENYERLVLDPSLTKPRRMYEVFVEKALLWGADGVIVGATKPTIIAEVRSLLRDKVPIYSPGLIVQGGSIEEVLKSGADYLIVGRAIVDSPIPKKSAEDIERLIEETLIRTRGR